MSSPKPPVVSPRSPAGIEASNENITCAICNDPLHAGDRQTYTVACGHTFHAACVLQWGQLRRNDCPICRGLMVGAGPGMRIEDDEGNSCEPGSSKDDEGDLCELDVTPESGWRSSRHDNRPDVGAESSMSAALTWFETIVCVCDDDERRPESDAAGAPRGDPPPQLFRVHDDGQVHLLPPPDGGWTHALKALRAASVEHAAFSGAPTAARRSGAPPPPTAVTD